jgi:hypothetical protein
MKTRNLHRSLPAIAVAIVTTLAVSAGNVAAQDSSASTSSAAPQLSYGVSQVLQLSQAKVSDGVIVQYIQNSGTIYALSAPEIVYLKQQGVSDIVLNTMLDQRRRITGSSEPNTPVSANPAVTQTTATTVVQPTVTYVQTAPAYVPASTVYIIPDTRTYSYNTYYYRPYYYPFVGASYGWGYPGVSLSFGFGGGWGGHYRGGFHSGFHGGYGGGYHGGWHHR